MKIKTTPTVYVEVYFNEEERRLFWEFMINNVENIYAIVHAGESSGYYHKGFYSAESAQKITDWVKLLNKKEEG